MHNMTPMQCRMARAALNWTIQRLADKATVSRNSIARFESGMDARISTVNVMRDTFERQGVRFIENGVVYEHPQQTLPL